MTDGNLLAIFLVGLLGGVHCLGMCGGIVTAVSGSMPAERRLGLQLAYNAGRIASYTLAGLLAGAIGASSVWLEGFFPAQKLLYLLANLMLVVLGLYLAGIWQGVLWLERFGSHLWRHVQPLAKGFFPVTTVPRALVVGAVWGWLPCGLVYSVLVTALASGHALEGARVMLVFGLGTLPNLMAMGLLASGLQRLRQQKQTRLLAGLLVAGYGLWGLSHLI